MTSIAVLHLLLTLQTKNGVWNEWAANYCTHFSDPTNFKVSAFMAMFWKSFALILSLFSTVKMAKPGQLLTTVLGAVATGTITVLSMVVRAFTVVSMLPTVMVAKDAKIVILLLSLALNVTREREIMLFIGKPMGRSIMSQEIYSSHEALHSLPSLLASASR